jgi:hypothetical protein
MRTGARRNVLFAKCTSARLLGMRKKKPAPKKKPVRRKKLTLKKKSRRRKKVTRDKNQARRGTLVVERGPGSGSAGQSGDIQGLPRVADADSESVEELLEEGQAFEAEAISGVENAPDADVAEVTTKEVPEDDVPPEYRDRE